MKFNIAFPSTGSQKIFEVDDERKIRAFIDKRLAQEVEGEALGDQFKGYVFKITGGFDREGFPMKQGVLVPNRVQVLLSKGTSCYRPRRDGERKRKSVRGCIVSHEISVLNLVIVKKGPEEVPGLTDKYIPRRLGPKRANKIRKLFDLSKEDDVRKYVIRRELPPKVAKEGAPPPPTTTKSGKPIRPRTKAPKIQRLITPALRQRKRHERSLRRRRFEKSAAAAAEFAKLKALRARERRQSTLSTRRSQSQRRESQKQDATKDGAVVPPTAAAAKPVAPKAKGPLSPAAAKGKAEPKAKGAPAPTAAKPKAPKAKPAEGKAAPKAPAAKPKAAEGKGAPVPKAAGEKKPKEKSAKK